MADGRAPTLDSITTALLGMVPADVARDLSHEDPEAAVDLHFGPVGFQRLPRAGIAQSDCSTDGYYDSSIDPSRPWIIYASDVHPSRVRFTILHELGHHLFVTAAAPLLDDLDVLGKSPDGAAAAEEAVCHRFAGRLLVPDEMLSDAIGDSPVVPRHAQLIHASSAASWEAVAVRVAEHMRRPGAVLLIRDAGTVSFCAASSTLGWSWWPRGSRVRPGGPLARALSREQTALPETYRFEMPYACSLFCDTLPVHDHLAVAVLSEKPSDGSVSLIEPAEPAWRSREQFCAWHPGVERDVGWCDACQGQRCPECLRCACSRPVENPVCPGCGLRNAFRTGATLCRDCEADLGA